MTKRPTDGGRHYRDPKTGELSKTPPKEAPAPAAADPITQADEAEAPKGAAVKKGR